MWKLLAQLNKNLIIALPIMMILGFIYGILLPTAFMKHLILPITFLMVYPMMVNLKVKKVLEGGDLKTQGFTQVINFLVIPFVALGLGLLFFENHPYMALGLVLTGLIPTSGMTISWTGLAKGNVEAAIKMTVIGLILGTLAAPLYLRFLMGTELDINTAAIIKQMALIVFLPFMAGFGTRQLLIKKLGMERFQKELAPRFPVLSLLGVLGIVFMAVALKAKMIAANPGLILYILVPLLIFYLLNYTVGTIVGKLFLPKGDSIALVYGSVMRNLSIALAIALNAFGPEGSTAALVVAVAFIIQVQSAVWYSKFIPRIYATETKATGKTLETAS